MNIAEKKKIEVLRRLNPEGRLRILADMMDAILREKVRRIMEKKGMSKEEAITYLRERLMEWERKVRR
ncbi:MAG: hypothetical protein ACTSXJ_02495 [Candidatus Baldrarchaeia archaeon]